MYSTKKSIKMIENMHNNKDINSFQKHSLKNMIKGNDAKV